MRRTLTLSTDRLPPNLQASFRAVLDVARTRSVADWQIRRTDRADLVCCTAETADSAGGIGDNQMRLWLEPRGVADSLMVQGDVSVDPQAIRVLTVLGALDFAALRLMDTSIYPHLNSSPTNLAERRDAASPAQRPDDAVRYTLRHWPTLTGVFAGRSYMNAAGMLSRRALTVSELSRVSGLPLSDTTALIDELVRRRSLRTVSAARAPGHPAPAARDTAFAGGAAQSGNLLGRIRNWLARSAA